MNLLEAATEFATKMGDADNSAYKLGFMAGASHVRKAIEENVVEDLDYWRKRCEAAEDLITQVHTYVRCNGNRYDKWQKIKNKK